METKTESENLTKKQAIEAMRCGKRVTHYHFTDDEWITIRGDGVIVSEDGVEHPDFWIIRHQGAWETDWFIVDEPPPSPDLREQLEEANKKIEEAVWLLKRCEPYVQRFAGRMPIQEDLAEFLSKHK